MTDKKTIKVSSRDQSGGQTAGTIINNVTNVTNVIAINGVVLSGDTQDLMKILVDEYGAQELANMLHGAWYALKSPSGNPDYLAHAAHSMREFIEKAPRILDHTPAKVKSGGLKNAVIGLSGKWSKATASTRTIDTSEWSGEIDNPFKKVLKSLADFFNTFDSSHRPRGHLNRAVLTQLNGATQPIPEKTMKELLEEYERLDDYFKGIAHHNITITKDTDADMEKGMEKIQDIMLRLKSPSRLMTIETLNSIDALISEGNGL